MLNLLDYIKRKKRPIQFKEFSEYANNNVTMANKWLTDNNNKIKVISTKTYWNNINGSMSYIITYQKS